MMSRLQRLEPPRNRTGHRLHRRARHRLRLLCHGMVDEAHIPVVFTQDYKIELVLIQINLSEWIPGSVLLQYIQSNAPTIDYKEGPYHQSKHQGYRSRRFQ